MDNKYENMRKIPSAEKYSVADLSEREKEVLVCLCNGMSNKEIAAELCLSMRTVKNHLSNIYPKIHVADRTQAAIYAIKAKLVFV